MDRFDVDELDFESVEPIRPSSFDGTASQKFEIAIRARQALPSLSLSQSGNAKLKYLDWRYVKKDKDITIHRLELEKPSNTLTTRVSFRLSCEIKSFLETIMDALVPLKAIEYLHMEKRMFPKFVDAAVLRHVEDDEVSELPSYPRHSIKWHASHLLTNRITGRMGTPTDFVFEEFADVETIENVQCGFGYMQSCEIPDEEEFKRICTVKCKRGLIRKSAFLVRPIAPDSVIHEVTAMYIMDFPKNLGISSDRIIYAYADRLRNIREMLINTLFQPIPILPRDQWVDDRSRKECRVCMQTFTIVRARHHCRACGEVVCGNCSRKWSVPVKNNGELLTRLCTPCSLKARSNLMPTVVHTNRFSRSNTTLDPPMSDFEMHLQMSSYHPHLNSLPLDKPIIHSVRVGSAISIFENTLEAIEDAWHNLVKGPLQLNRPHFALINYTMNHNPYVIADTLHRLAPDLVFCGAAMTMEKGDVTFFQGGRDGRLNKYSHLISIWGLFDVDGQFSTNGVGFVGIDPKEATRQCIKQSIHDLDFGPTESPDMLWLMPTDGFEEPVVRAVGDMLDTTTTILGTTSKYSRLCGSGIHGTFVMTDEQPGVVVAMCSPSMQVSQAYFSCYEPNERVFTVTKAEGKRLLELDHNPPLTMLKDGLDRHKRKLYMGSKQKVFPAFGRMSKGPGGDIYVQQIEPVGVHSDMSMTLAAPICRDDQLRLMSMDAKMIPDEIAAGLHLGRDNDEVLGCYISLGPSILQHMGEDAHLLQEAVLHGMGRNPNVAITGTLSMTQIGIMSGTHRLMHGNGMIVALIITNSQKKSMRPRGGSRAQRRSF
ncbi:hypothetical protein THRCLA_01723 [Thraustotheca clavata]|uniref:FYVE-type domain-containing protein n=1 Tax=Thraustotheca clavata TaxID=74557 RepID=A0A1W0A7G1_9STRA|nr:hypothetical protein THRCLA_01723 [Thraustotheca clavata]